MIVEQNQKVRRWHKLTEKVHHWFWRTDKATKKEEKNKLKKRMRYVKRYFYNVLRQRHPLLNCMQFTVKLTVWSLKHLDKKHSRWKLKEYIFYVPGENGLFSTTRLSFFIFIRAAFLVISLSCWPFPWPSSYTKILVAHLPNVCNMHEWFLHS